MKAEDVAALIADTTEQLMGQVVGRNAVVRGYEGRSFTVEVSDGHRGEVFEVSVTKKRAGKE